MDINRFNKIYSEEKQKFDAQSAYTKKFLNDVNNYWLQFLKNTIENITDDFLDNSIAKIMQRSPLADTFTLSQRIIAPQIFRTHILYCTKNVGNNDLWINTEVKAECKNIDFTALANHCAENKYGYIEHNGYIYRISDQNEIYSKQLIPTIRSRLSQYGLAIKDIYFYDSSINVIFYNPCKK